MASPIIVVALKASRDVPLGIGLTGKKDKDTVRITSIASDGLFAASDLKVGMVLGTVNGTKCATANEAVALLREADRQVTIVAYNSGYAPTKTKVDSTLPSSSSSSVTIVITKPSKKSKIGIHIAFGRGGRLKVKSIDPHGPFAGTDLKVGMQIVTINGRMYSTYNEGEALLNEATGRVTIVASKFDEKTSSRSNKRDTAGADLLLNVVGSGLDAGSALGSVDIGCCAIS